MEKIIFGISYGATIVECENLKECMNLGIDLIEIPIIEDTSKIINFCVENNIKIAFHIPNSYDKKNNIETIKDIDKYIKLISDILTRYKNVTIEYIIVHFPFVNLSRNGFNYDLEYAIDKLESIKKKHKINIYIENVSINEKFFSAIHYKEIIKNRDIKICYDIGHANVINKLIKNSDSQDYVDSFFNTLKEDIECMHYYNTPNKESDEYKIGEHYPFIKFNNDDKYGFINYKKVQEKIINLPNLKYVTMEVRRNEYMKYKQIGDYTFLKGRE